MVRKTYQSYLMIKKMNGFLCFGLGLKNRCAFLLHQAKVTVLNHTCRGKKLFLGLDNMHAPPFIHEFLAKSTEKARG